MECRRSTHGGLSHTHTLRVPHRQLIVNHQSFLSLHIYTSAWKSFLKWSPKPELIWDLLLWFLLTPCFVSCSSLDRTSRSVFWTKKQKNRSRFISYGIIIQNLLPFQSIKRKKFVFVRSNSDLLTLRNKEVTIWEESIKMNSSCSRWQNEIFCLFLLSIHIKFLLMVGNCRGDLKAQFWEVDLAFFTSTKIIQLQKFKVSKWAAHFLKAFSSAQNSTLVPRKMWSDYKLNKALL